MKQRAIGTSSLTCGIIGLGCNQMVDPTNREAVDVVHRAVDLGINQFDSADIYGNGRSEEFLGRVLRSRRAEVVIASKFGVRRTANGNVFDGSPQYVRLACEASLRRLGISEIDLYYQHAMDPTVPIEETIGAMLDLKLTGKIRALGLCNTTPELIRRAHAVHPIAEVQMEYSLMERRIEDDILPTCEDLGITLVAFGPLTYAFLTGQITKHADLPEADGFRRRQSRFQNANIEKNLPLLASLHAIAAELGATPAQIALAWCLHRPHDVLPVPGSTWLRHLEENATSADVKLSQRQIDELDHAFAHGIAHGDGRPGKLPVTPRLRSAMAAL
jgi:aryl-alcohol dehydrogenase-like predicted oxidoreductase